MLAGLAGAAALPLAYLAAYAICFAMSVAYSVPPMRLKAVAGADWVINMLGFGTLTPVAGWAATGRPFDATHAIVLAAFCPLFAALYPLTQLYQLEEDARRGDRTLAVRLGVVTSLSVAIAAAAVAFALLTLAAIRSAWPTTGGAAWRWAALCAAAAAWAAVLVPWRIRARSLGPPEHQRGMYWALGAWALTDLAVAAVWAT
jgi:4-hydroxybenzoate polyprenyltransferase